MRIVPRFNVKFNQINTSSGSNLPRVNELRYLGTYIITFRSSICSLDYAKRAF